MGDQQLLERIAYDPKVMAGKPVIRGTRLSVEYILNLLAQGTTAEEILDEYVAQSSEDIQACLLFASQSLSSAAFMPLVAESMSPLSLSLKHSFALLEGHRRSGGPR